MPIQIKRNAAGNCVNFLGTSNPAYWNACLSAEQADSDATLINIVNDKATLDTGEKQYEFFEIPYTEFRDEDNNPFSSASETAQYITDKANVAGSQREVRFSGNQTINFSRDATNATILIDNGAFFPVNAIKASVVSGTVTVSELTTSGAEIYTNINHEKISIGSVLVGGDVDTVVNKLNALFTVSPLGGGTSVIPTYSVSGTSSINYSSFGTSDPSGTPIAADSSAVSGYGRFFSTDFINNPGEFFLVKMTGQGSFTLGVYHDGVDTDLSSSNTNAHSDQLWSLAFYDYGDYISGWTIFGREPGFVYGDGWTGASSVDIRYNTTVQDATLSGDPVLYKVGISNQGYLEVSYFDEGRSDRFKLLARTSYNMPEGDYGLMIKFMSEDPKLYEVPTVSLVDPEVVIAYRYIESPDGSYHYPLFSTSAEASIVDASYGGSGTAHVHVYVDEPTNTSWYMPDTSGFMSQASGPVDTSNITYTEIPTLADELFAPSAFTINDISVNEGAAVIYQVAESGATYTTTLDGLPPGLSKSGNFITGTAPDVSGHYIENPSDVFDVSVTRTNNYGSTATTFDLSVINLTAPDTAVSGFTWLSGSVPLIDTSTMDSSSVVTIDNTLDRPKRFIIPQSWVEAFVLPKLQTSGNAIWMGITESSGVLTDGVIPDDFKAYIKWEHDTSSSHKSIIGGDTSSSVIVNSSSDAFYDYAFEADDTSSLYVIACNISDINSQPGVDYGGSFSRTVEASGESPFTNNIVTDGVQMTLDPSGLSEIIIPKADRWIQVSSDNHTLQFDGASAFPTLSVGYDYRFLMADVEWINQVSSTSLSSTDILKFTADGATEYTSGVTRTGTVGTQFAHVDFSVPSSLTELYWYNDHNGISTSAAVTLSGVSTLTTTWTKTLDFEGSTEYCHQYFNGGSTNPLRTGGYAVSAPANSDSTKTSDNVNSRPWAVACVFNIDGDSSDQTIWAQGEGTNTGNDNITLEVDSSRNLTFNWGREGTGYNTYDLGTLTAGTWYGLYVEHMGGRFAAADATTANLDASMRFRFVDLSNGNVSTPAGSWSSSGVNQNEQISGSFVVGGLGTVRSFVGKISSVVVTTLSQNITLPSDTEVSMIVRDPLQWLTDYKVGNDFRRSNYQFNTAGFNTDGTGHSAASCQVWLMGDGTNDAYSTIRNQVNVNDSGTTAMRMRNMVSGDIEDVTIPGLS